MAGGSHLEEGEGSGDCPGPNMGWTDDLGCNELMLLWVSAVWGTLPPFYIQL